MLDGSSVRPGTQRKLQDWWDRHQRSDHRTAREVAIDSVLEFVESRSTRHMVRDFLLEHTKDVPRF